MNIMNYPRSVIVPQPAREGQFGNVESKTEVGVSCDQGQAAADEKISEKDQLNEKGETKVHHKGANKALGSKLLSAGLAEGQHLVPPRIFLHQTIQESSVPLPVCVENFSFSDLVFNPVLQPEFLA